MEDFTLKPCAPWAEKLAATYPEDLSPSDLTELEAHLATCPACKAVHEEYHFLDDRIRDIPVAKLQPKIPFFQLLKLQEDPKQDLSKLDGRAPISPHADVLYHMPKYDATPTTDSEHQGIPLEHEKIGNYRIKQVLGSGTFGRVYLGEHIELGTPAAIKVLTTLSTDNELEKSKFRDEARIIAHLDHLNIVRVKEFGVEGITPYLVMDYAPGGTLRKCLPANTRLSLYTVVSYVQQIAAALQYAHNQRIIHRDVKPENVLLDRTNNLLLSDFGIATIVQSTSNQNLQTVAGTILYMAPEQLQGKARPASDQYSLGIIAYELLSGTRPFEGSWWEIVSQHVGVTPPSLRDKVPTIPPAVEQVVLKALAKDPRQRHESVEAFADALERALPRPPSTVVSSSNLPTEIITRRPPKTPLLLVLVALLIAVLIASIFAGLVVYQQNTTTNSCSAASVSLLSSPDCTAIIQAPDGESIGISNGTFAFDTDRADGHLKLEAANALKAGDTQSANAYWNLAIAEDTTDAEASIYQENQTVLHSGNPYITFIVTRTLTGDAYSINVGRDILQGAYVAQKEYNANHKLPGGVQVRLLIANIGNPSMNAMTVAQQIVQAKKADRTIIGVMGWPFRSDSVNEAIKYLAANNIPIVSPTASSDALTGILSPYFFSVAPSINNEAIAGAKYAEQTLHAKKVEILYDPADPYSTNLANDFAQQFKADGDTTLEDTYTIGHPEVIHGLVQDAITGNPDLKLIYFTGYSDDASKFLPDIQQSWPNVQVMGGDALYQFVHSPNGASFQGLYFTAFAYHSEWEGRIPKPPFFPEYKKAFDPLAQHIYTYGHSLPDSDAILSYDAMSALLSASNTALAGKKQSLTSKELQQALAKITPSQPLQGVSGQISFGPDGNPQDKAVVVLYVTSKGSIQLESIQGRYR